MRCDLQIFSGCVCHLEQLHAQSPFLFPIVYGINGKLQRDEVQKSCQRVQFEELESHDQKAL